MSGDSPSLVDAHAHFHPGFPERRFLDSATRNFRKGARALGAGPEARGYLVLAQGPEGGKFEQWRRRAEGGAEDEAADPEKAGEWRFAPTDEKESVVARRGTGVEIVVVAGRQVRTRERLEVLAPGTDRPLAEGRPVEEVLEAVRGAGAVPILAWGFGKWWGRRGKRVDELVRRAEPGRLLLGDQPGRPRPAPAPPQFRAAARRGIPVLPGSDPLSLPGHVHRVGSYGLALQRDLGTRRPAAELRRALAGLRGQPRRYGRRDGVLRCLFDQVALRVRSRK